MNIDKFILDKYMDVKQEPKIYADEELCSRCMICMTECSNILYDRVNNKIVIGNNCNNCGKCLAVCPNAAIIIKRNEDGENK